MDKSKRNRYAGKGTNKRKSSNKATGRDYSYDSKYQSSPEQKKNRAKRNAARKKMIDQGKAKVGDGKDVHHVKGVSAGNGNKNLKVTSRKYNRGKK